MRHFTRHELREFTTVYNQSKEYGDKHVEWETYQIESEFVVVNITENGDGEELAQFTTDTEAIEYTQNNI